MVLHIDHVTPVARGGRTALDNLRVACAACNQGKAASPLIERAIRCQWESALCAYVFDHALVHLHVPDGHHHGFWRDLEGYCHDPDIAPHLVDLAFGSTDWAEFIARARAMRDPEELAEEDRDYNIWFSRRFPSANDNFDDFGEIL